MSIQVRALEQGYYGLAIRNAGSVFEIERENDFSERWMERFVPGSVFDPAPERKTSQVVAWDAIEKQMEGK